VTHDQATRWAIARLIALLSNPHLHLNAGEASLAAEAMTALTNNLWSVKREEQRAQMNYRAFDTGKPEIWVRVGINQHKGGSL
jgi:hypothetical protein